MLGEAKWQVDTVRWPLIKELIEQKTPKVLKTLPEEGNGWKVYYAFFARTGFTDAARTDAAAVGAMLVDLQQLDEDLAR